MTDSSAATSGEAAAASFGHYHAGFIPTLVSGVAHQPLGDEAIAWSPQFSQPTYLDPVAKVLLGIIDGGATMAELTDDIEEVFEVDRELAAAQLVRVIGVLDYGGLLESSLTAQIFGGDPPSGSLPEPDY